MNFGFRVESLALYGESLKKPPIPRNRYANGKNDEWRWSSWSVHLSFGVILTPTTGLKHFEGSTHKITHSLDNIIDIDTAIYETFSSIRFLCKCQILKVLKMCFVLHKIEHAHAHKIHPIICFDKVSAKRRKQIGRGAITNTHICISLRISYIIRSAEAQKCFIYAKNDVYDRATTTPPLFPR